MGVLFYGEKKSMQCSNLGSAELAKFQQVSFSFFFGCAGSLLQTTIAVLACGLWSMGSVVVSHGLTWFIACGIFPDQGANPCPLYKQVDSYPLCHQGSPLAGFLLENHLEIFFFFYIVENYEFLRVAQNVTFLSPILLTMILVCFFYTAPLKSCF